MSKIFKIKTLKWEQVSKNSYEAKTSFGSYRIDRSENGECIWTYYFVEYYDEGTFDCFSIDDGKKSAEKHWIERISQELEEIS